MIYDILPTLHPRTLLEDVSFQEEYSIDATTSTASAAHRRYLIYLFSMEYWWTIGGFLGVLTILHLAHLISDWIILFSAKSRYVDPEKSANRSLPRSKSSITRIWRSAKSLVNIVLFRLPIPLKKIHNIGNVAEVLCIGAYIGATLAWALMSTPDINLPTVSISAKLSHLRNNSPI